MLSVLARPDHAKETLPLFSGSSEHVVETAEVYASNLKRLHYATGRLSKHFKMINKFAPHREDAHSFGRFSHQYGAQARSYLHMHEDQDRVLGGIHPEHWSDEQRHETIKANVMASLGVYARTSEVKLGAKHAKFALKHFYDAHHEVDSTKKKALEEKGFAHTAVAMDPSLEYGEFESIQDLDEAYRRPHRDLQNVHIEEGKGRIENTHPIQ